MNKREWEKDMRADNKKMMSKMDIRAIVVERMKELPPPWRNALGYRKGKPGDVLNANILASLAYLPTRTVYNFVTGKSQISAEKLGDILDALELEITPKKKPQASA